MVDEEMGMFEDEVRMIELAAPLHDLGKIAIPDALLMKPGPLTDEETRLMRRHPEIGHELLSGSQNRFIQLSATIALRHQERYDGSGYPDGLAGDEIRSEEHTSELPSLLRISYAVFCLKKKKKPHNTLKQYDK